MSALQWALLLLGIGGIVLLVAASRRERGAAAQGPRQERPAPVSAADARPERPFDEYGVSKPRRRIGGEPRPARRREPVVTLAEGEAPPARLMPGFIEAEQDRAPAPQSSAAPERIVALFIAEHEGTRILGARLHAALHAQGLQYNERKKAYDRVEGDDALYSVTSLTAPGHLDPAEAQSFSTPGLALFMRLPGPSAPVAAFRDMLSTAHALALSLNALVFDGSHQPLSEERLRILSAEVEEWARRHAAA